jgi:Tol biopolymer transport system component
MLNIETQELSVMSNGLLDESPHFSPNGDMIIFSSNRKKKGMLSVISVKSSRSYELSFFWHNF